MKNYFKIFVFFLLVITSLSTSAQRNVKVTESFRYTATNPQSGKVLVATDSEGNSAWQPITGACCTPDTLTPTYIVLPSCTTVSNRRNEVLLVDSNNQFTSTACQTIQYLNVDTINYTYNLGRPYYVYTAIITQSGTDAPVANVLENTLGEITFGYTTIGTYTINSDSLFTNNNTVAYINNPPVGYSIITKYSTTSLIDIYAYNVEDNILEDDIPIQNDNLSLLEIRVYK